MIEKDGRLSFGPDDLKPFRVPKTAEIFADHIRSRIILGELQEGDFLPPEGQLLSSLGISRPTLREALRILETEGMISVVRGSRSGAQVHSPKVAIVARHAGFVLQAGDTTISDIYEARLAIEPFAARRLAEKRPEGAVERLEAEADRLTVLVNTDRYVDFMIGLAEFHKILVELSGNRTLLMLTELLQDVLARHQVNFFRNREMDMEEQRRRSLWGLKSFRKLIELIAAGDGEQAEAHWKRHVINANNSWVPPGEEKTVINVLGPQSSDA